MPCLFGAIELLRGCVCVSCVCVSLAKPCRCQEFAQWCQRAAEPWHRRVPRPFGTKQALTQSTTPDNLTRTQGLHTQQARFGTPYDMVLIPTSEAWPASYIAYAINGWKMHRLYFSQFPEEQRLVGTQEGPHPNSLI
eukprot:575497-Amphidinium_carterae.1